MKLKYTEYSHRGHLCIDILWDRVERLNYKIKEEMSAEKYYRDELLKQLSVIQARLA